MDAGIKRLLKNTLIAQSLADAFGYIVEFKNWDSIRKFYGDDGLKYNPKDLHLIASDDTQMSLFCLNGLRVAANSAIHKHGEMEDPTDEIYRSYLDWYKTQSEFYNDNNDGLMKYQELYHKRAPGNTCLSALGSKRKGTMKNPINDSKGCGGVMRTMPIAFFASNVEEAFLWGAKQAALTHGHPDGYLSSAAYAAIVYELLHNTRNILDAVKVIEPILEQYHHSDNMLSVLNKTVWTIKDIPGLTKNGLTKELGNGWVGEEAFAVALYCAATSISFSEVLEKASNHSGDSDSTASLAAALWYLSTRDESFLPDFKYLDLEKCISDFLDKV